ncbi:MAG TPA: L,D-transpeptidase family protein [Thermoanaerobaculia bacterium]|nr:L,D-transpeptidase family protein [Thermoanaerobaculia bacterium]
MLPVLLTFLLSISPGTPAVDDRNTIAGALAALERGETVTVAGEPICSSRPLVLFYQRRNNDPAWQPADREALLRAIHAAANEGLDPRDYHLGPLETRSLAAPDLDLLATDAFFLLGSHLLSGRVDPVSIEPTWCLAPRTNDLVGGLETALETHDVEATLARMAPSHHGYVALRGALAAMRQMDATGGWQRVDPGKPLRINERDPRVVQLIARLVASGEIAQGHTDFDVAVDAAVRRFQRLHGLADDGVVGPRTIAELNVPASDRVRQLELNLERWRWLPATLGDPYAVINIPAFSLTLYEHGRSILSARVVVGKDYLRTPIVSSKITEVVLSPYWNVPESIARKELWPKERRQRGYLRREHIEVLSNGRLRQTPGPWNSLGLIKFNLPNPYDVYLHDTPAKDLFGASVRAFSHGCMRVENAPDLAAWLLRDRPEWPRERIVAESERGVQQIIAVRAPVAIHVLYWTAFIDDAGELHFAPDIYDRDGPLDAAMRARPSSR